MSKVDIEKILELEAKATIGNWEKRSWASLCLQGRELTHVADFYVCPKDAELIAVMRNNIVALCDELKAAREIVSYHRASLCAVARSYLSCTCYGCALLRKYDEVTKDGEG